MRKFFIFILLFSVLTFINSNTFEPYSNYNNYSASKLETKSSILEEKHNTSPIFTKSSIPDTVYSKMLGCSIPNEAKNNIDISTLSYLQISYYGFDKNIHTGEMIVNSKLSDEVLRIFKDLYYIQYPIEKIRLIDEYGADDELSMSDNNTSCFCYRPISGTSKLSYHSYGTAIDINPLYNPYVSSKGVSPVCATLYSDRGFNFEHQIQKNDELYNIFISRGWTWGGDWKTPKDYQHFEKKI